MKGIAAGLGLALAISATPALAQKVSPIGVWLSQGGDARVRIAPCGQQVCGTIVWVKTPRKDVHNPNPADRNRDLVGVTMLSMAPSGDGLWTGPYYRYTDGQTFKGTLKMSGRKTLELSGCYFGGFICRTQTWVKVN